FKFPAVDFFNFQAKGNIIEHREMGKQGIALKYGVDFAIFTMQGKQVLSVNKDGAGVRFLKTGNDT
ncbi:MAG: hypothetical protein QG618_434, partial [Thermodesulfobacteriota bacterium]|nr:hypothetical protein [Thermodesulfobacteriota bacterium]